LTAFEKRISQLRRSVGEQESGGFRFTPFSKKQRLVLGWWCEGSPYAGCDGVIADGAVRSGKTVAMSLGFVMWAMHSFSGRSFAICAKTIGSAERNILTQLRQILKNRGYTLREDRSRHLMTVSKGSVSNDFYCFGGRDESSQDLIQGMTLAGVYLDEAALMPESFVSQATARCSVDGSKLWFNCNPEGPYHWFKKGWIDRRKERNLLYVHFEMADNLSLSKEIIERYMTMYQGVFHRRYVLGEWCAAQGLVYPMFDAERNIGGQESAAERWFMSCDYGTQNPFALGLISARKGEDGDFYCLEKEFYHDGRKKGQMTDSEYADALEEFAKDTQAQTVVVDPSAASFIAELRSRGWKVIKAKNDVAEGIRCVARALSAGKLRVMPSCENTIREFATYIWDETACSRGDDRPVKQNDHAMDMLRYALMTDRKPASARKERYSGKGAT